MIVGRIARIDLTRPVSDNQRRIINQETGADNKSKTKYFQTGMMANIEMIKGVGAGGSVPGR
jgi:hypothetical protein